jgi:hypothetical protein
MFDFENLNEKTRALMLRELDRDTALGILFFDNRLKEDSQDRYFDLLRKALEYGTPEAFSEAILGELLLKKTEARDLGEKQIRAKISNIAHYNIGEGEFNRYYMRAICLIAIEDGLEDVDVYRAKQVSKPRPASAGRMKAKELLDNLRTTNISVQASFPGPNSGRSVRLPK